MHVLIVYAHAEPKSFNGAMKDTAVATLTAAGHTVEVSDLHAMDFRPADGPRDFAGTRADADFLQMQAEQRKAVADGTLAPDIRAEQEKLKRADLLIFQFPLYWFNLPAILKGWVDRVFSAGFAYGGGMRYDEGPFRGRRAMLAMTTGGNWDTFAPDGLHGHLDGILWPIHNGIFRYVGYDVLPPFIAWSAGRVDQATRVGYLETYAEHLRGLAELQPLYFHPASDFDARNRLKPGVAGRTAGQRYAAGRAIEPGVPRRITEVGAVVRDLEGAAGLLRDLFDAEVDEAQTVNRYGMRFRMVRIGEVDFELMEPTGEAGVIADFLKKRGEGLHHIAFAVDDIDALMTRLRARGVRFVDAGPVELELGGVDFVGQRFKGGVRIAFSHPRSHMGMLLEFIQYPKGYRTGVGD